MAVIFIIYETYYMLRAAQMIHCPVCVDLLAKYGGKALPQRGVRENCLQPRTCCLYQSSDLGTENWCVPGKLHLENEIQCGNIKR
jgi:hypothetical protein